MLLVIDAGNTNTVFAVFNDSELVGKWRISTDPRRTADEYILHLSYLLALEELSLEAIDGVIISNVVPQSSYALKQFSRKYLNCEPLIVGEGNVAVGIEVVLDRPSEIGADRMVNAVAALNRFGGNVVIIDFGTATTFDVVSEKGQYIGGVIAPGINLSIEALHMAAAKLPQVAVAKPAKVIGTSTVEAMQSGIYWGYIGLIEGIISRIKKEKNVPFKVLATGGLAPLFFEATDAIEHLEMDLTIFGLQQIYKIN